MGILCVIVWVLSMKYEYLTAKVCVPHSIPDTAILRGAGLEGWELVSVDNGIAYFKRPVSEIAVYKDGLKLDFPYKGTYE